MTPNGCAAAITAASRRNCVAMVTTIVVIGKMKTTVNIVSDDLETILSYLWTLLHLVFLKRIPIFLYGKMKNVL